MPIFPQPNKHYVDLLSELHRMEQIANRLAGVTPSTMPNQQAHILRLAELAQYVRRVNDTLNAQLEVWDK